MPIILIIYYSILTTDLVIHNPTLTMANETIVTHILTTNKNYYKHNKEGVP